ncbi:hypothetical protein BDY19DRAFT_994387 [Irpex rosettiformis]|uniref:Uncharacterized protein n=1 Tax=Irpex rosettiformis TaxID=378272 RepID=A0ACB8U0Y7_9APHY|nr:hypothetical protein BDY19DRAFT_994387 [Irpex rosettiformis]
MQRLTRKRSASLSSTAEAAHYGSTEPKRERTGLIRKLSQTFIKPSDNDSSEKSHRPRKLSISSIMSSVIASASQTSLLLTTTKDSDTTTITTTTTSPPRVKASKAGHRMDLKPGKHTADRVYAPTSLPHSKSGISVSTKKTYKGGKPVLKENIRRLDVVDLEFRSSEDTLCEYEGSGSSLGHKGRNDVETKAKEERVVERKGSLAMLRTRQQRLPPLIPQRPRPKLEPKLKPTSEFNEYGLNAADELFMKNTFHQLRSMGLPVPSLPFFEDCPEHLHIPAATVQKAVASTEISSSPLPEAKHSPTQIPPLPCSPPSTIRSPTPVLTPLSIGSGHDRAPPRQSIPLTIGSMSLVPSTYNSPTSPTLPDEIVIEPGTISSDSSFEDSDFPSDFSDTGSCYSQSSYHPTVIDKTSDLGDDDNFSLPSNAPPVPALPSGVTDNFDSEPAQRVTADLNIQNSPRPAPTVRAPRVVAVRTPASRTCAEVPLPIPVPTPPRPSRPPPNNNNQRPSPLKSVPVSVFDTRAHKKTSTMLNDAKLLPSPSSLPPPSGSVSLPKTMHTHMHKPLPVELLRQSSAKEQRRTRPPPRSYSPEFNSTPTVSHVHTSARSPLSGTAIAPSPHPPHPARSRIQNQPCTSSLSTRASTTTARQLSPRFSAASLSSSRPSHASRTTAPTSIQEDGGNENDMIDIMMEDGEWLLEQETVQTTGGLSWMKANGKVQSGSWYAPAPAKVVSTPEPTKRRGRVLSARENLGAMGRSVDSRRTNASPLSAPHTGIAAATPAVPTMSRRQATPTPTPTTTTTRASSAVRSTGGSHSRSGRAGSVSTTVNSVARRTNGPPSSESRTKPTPLSPPPSSFSASASSYSSFSPPLHRRDTPASNSLLFASIPGPVSAPVTVPRDDMHIMRNPSPLPPLNTNKAERSVRVMNGTGGVRDSVRVAEVGVVSSSGSSSKVARGGRKFKDGAFPQNV